jgi:hypothetical protein
MIAPAEPPVVPGVWPRYDGPTQLALQDRKQVDLTTGERPVIAPCAWVPGDWRTFHAPAASRRPRRYRS